MEYRFHHLKFCKFFIRKEVKINSSVQVIFLQVLHLFYLYLLNLHLINFLFSSH